MKKTLKTIGICVLITTFITSIIYFGLISYLNNQILTLWFNADPSISMNLEVSANTCRNIENLYINMETNALDSFESYIEYNQSLQLPEDFPRLGLGLSNSILPMAFSFTRYIALIFIIAIVSGLTMGLLIDTILIKKKKGKKLVLSIITNLLVSLIIIATFTFVQNLPLVHEIGLIELLFSSLSSSILFIEFFLLILLVIYVGNYLIQLINIRKLNKELDPNPDTQKLKNKIILLTLIPIVFIILLAIIDYFSPYYLGIIYNSFIIQTLVDFIENNIFSFFEEIYCNFFSIQIGG